MGKKLKRLKNIRIHHEGTEILIACACLFAVTDFVMAMMFHSQWPFVAFTIFSVLVYLMMLNFFRCPIRLFGQPTENVVVAPADGKVVVVEEVEEPDYFHDRRLMVSIFMNIASVHANWYPVDGIVRHVSHHDGRFLAAYLPKASTENERSMVVIETPGGKQVMARQIAGAIARRIVTYATEGEECYIDEHMGFIKYGSRVDLYLPLDTELSITLGQKTTGNQTIIGKLK